jgi:hypothetical protein
MAQRLTPPARISRALPRDRSWRMAETISA